MEGGGGVRLSRPTRQERAHRFAADLGATPDDRPAVAAIVASMPLGATRWGTAVVTSMLVALLLSVPLALCSGIVVFAFADMSGPLGTGCFLVLWLGSSGAVLIGLMRLALRRARQDLASARVRARACVRCGSGIRGVTGPDSGLVRCPECGGETLRRPGAALADRPPIHAVTVAATVLPEPQSTLFEETVTGQDDVDELTVALAEGSPGLATPALLLATGVFIAGVGAGVPAWLLLLEVTMNVAGSATGGGLGSAVREVILPASIAVLLLLVFGLAWRVFRASASRAWRRVAITAIEAESCFWCRAPFRDAPAADGWHACRACGKRTPGRSRRPDAPDAPNAPNAPDTADTNA